MSCLISRLEFLLIYAVSKFCALFPRGCKSFITVLDGTNLSAGQAAVLNIIYKEYSK